MLPWRGNAAPDPSIDNSSTGNNASASMKLATYRDGSRDGVLVVVSNDLSLAHYASGVASRLQQVLDDWNYLSPQLEDLARTLDHGKARHAFTFDPRMCMAPLPRAYQWAAAAAYLNHVELARRARGAPVPERFHTDPLMVQGGSDEFLGPCDDIRCASEDHGIDFEAELAVITGDLAMGCTPEGGIDGVRLLMLVNDVSLRQLIPDELAKGIGFVQGKPAPAFSPVAVTPDELGAAWRGGKVHLRLESRRNGEPVGRCDAGAGMRFDFGQLIAHLCKTRNVRAGSIIGSGAVSSCDGSHGYSSIAEKRAFETIESGAPKTAYVKFGDTVRIETKGDNGLSVFGAIEQRVAPAVSR